MHSNQLILINWLVVVFFRTRQTSYSKLYLRVFTSVTTPHKSKYPYEMPSSKAVADYTRTIFHKKISLIDKIIHDFPVKYLKSKTIIPLFCQSKWPGNMLLIFGKNFQHKLRSAHSNSTSSIKSLRVGQVDLWKWHTRQEWVHVSNADCTINFLVVKPFQESTDWSRSYIDCRYQTICILNIGFESSSTIRILENLSYYLKECTRYYFNLQWFCSYFQWINK